MGKKIPNAPKIFHVNWFRLDENGKFMWPGFGDNLRVLNWILDRCEGKAGAKETAIGYLPNASDINVEGLKIDEATLENLLSVDKEVWKKEIEGQKEFFAKFGDDLPAEIKEELSKLEARLA